jgi:hypothetical protein
MLSRRGISNSNHALHKLCGSPPGPLPCSDRKAADNNADGYEHLVQAEAYLGSDMLRELRLYMFEEDTGQVTVNCDSAVYLLSLCSSNNDELRRRMLT